MFTRRFAVIAALVAFAASALLSSVAGPVLAAASSPSVQTLTEFDNLDWLSGSSAATTSTVA